MCVFITVFGATENGAVLQQDIQEVAEWLKMENFSSQVIQAFEGKASSYAIDFIPQCIEGAILL